MSRAVRTGHWGRHSFVGSPGIGADSMARNTRKKEIPPFAASPVNLAGVMPSEISQTEEDKQWIVSLLRARLKKVKPLETRSGQ